MLHLFLLLTGCLQPEIVPAPLDSGLDSGDTAGDTVTELAAWCAAEGFGTHHPWNPDGPYGDLRHDLADDFLVPLTDGSNWTLSEQWTGCENIIFVPDDIVRTVSAADSIWTKDLDEMIAGSPRNTHYFFVSKDGGDEGDANRDALVAQVEEELGGLKAEDAAWWSDHLHVASVPAKELNGWLRQMLRVGIGEGGFGIDRTQHVRGLGSFADNTRTDSSNSGWPFQNNLAFAALESRFFNMESARQDRLDAEVDPTLVQLWNGEIISEYADMLVELPTAGEMAAFDTFEIDVDMRCPEPNDREQGNCGAWDYLANFYVQDDAGNWIELSRFITTYHREARWVADATPMLPHLLAGGSRTFRWSWAPSWNVQPTETRLQLRFSNQGKGVRPRTATLVATGGGFNSAYNDGREAVSVDVAGAAKVQLWAITSGHGMEAQNCAEFCNHQHEFSVDGSTHLQEFTTAGTATGCIDQIENQMTPNQSGTWWYGRGGWCPGQIVMPYDVDVTADVGADGEAIVGYRGMYDDEAPPPDGAGTIWLNAWLVTYE